MGWLSKVFGSGLGETAEKIGGVVNKFAEGHLGKKELELELKSMMHARDMALQAEVTAEITAKERIMVAELQQGDKFTKRARPMIIYVGLAAAIIDAVEAIPFTMPDNFWVVWAGVCGVYVLGRSAEKYGKGGKLAAAITGSKILD
ncbi:unnamed protein product [marine sediment metagenome]|uniref:Holin of 3TMs, for gene-transfer release n=1 Tax=marine sediment metagenome TaxID=412755 RepID=X0S6W7_9ZZZZ